MATARKDDGITRACARCGEVRPVEDFRLRPDGRYRWCYCLDCERARLRLNARRHKAKQREARAVAPLLTGHRCTSPVCCDGAFRHPGARVELGSWILFGLAKRNIELSREGRAMFGFMVKLGDGRLRVYLGRRESMVFPDRLAASNWARPRGVKLVRLPE